MLIIPWFFISDNNHITLLFNLNVISKLTHTALIQRIEPVMHDSHYSWKKKSSSIHFKYFKAWSEALLEVII